MMASKLQLPGGIRTVNGVPADAKYFNNNDTPYTGTSQVLSQLQIGIRHPGLTVNVTGTEYWWPPDGGVTDGELTIKVGGGGGGDSHFLGKYTSLSNLEAAHPTALDGDYAIVDAGPGTDAVQYIWDEDEGWVAGNGVGGNIYTADGTLVSNRTVSGGGRSLSFGSFGSFILNFTVAFSGLLKLATSLGNQSIEISEADGIHLKGDVTIDDLASADSLVAIDSDGLLSTVPNVIPSSFPTSDGREYYISEVDETVTWQEIIDANGTSFDNKTKLQSGEETDWDDDDHYTGTVSGAITGTKGGMVFIGTDETSGAKYRYECITDNNWYRTQRIVSTLYLKASTDEYFPFNTDDSGTMI